MNIQNSIIFMHFVSGVRAFNGRWTMLTDFLLLMKGAGQE